MNYRLSQRSINNLDSVHPSLVACAVLALYAYTDIDFAVIEGVRSISRQHALLEQGKTTTLNSKHLIQPDSTAHAIDLAPIVDGKIPWDDWTAFERINDAMQKAADKLGIEITWGGSWKSFPDGPHFQLEI